MNPQTSAVRLTRRVGFSCLLFAISFFVISLSSCSWFLPEGAAPVDQVSGKVTGRSDGYVELGGLNAVYDPISFASADIGADGGFTIELKDVVPPSSGLFDLADWGGISITSYDAVSISDSDARLSFSQNGALSVYDETESFVGSLLLFDGPTISTSVGPGVQIIWIYADRDVTIEGTANVGSSLVYTFSMVMLEGWNQVALRISEGTPSQVLFETEQNPTGVEWYFLN